MLLKALTGVKNMTEKIFCERCERRIIQGGRVLGFHCTEEQLLKDVERVFPWFKTNGLELNLKNTVHLKKSNANISSSSVKISGISILIEKSIKLLGKVLYSNLFLGTHKRWRECIKKIFDTLIVKHQRKALPAWSFRVKSIKHLLT